MSDPKAGQLPLPAGRSNNEWEHNGMQRAPCGELAIGVAKAENWSNGKCCCIVTFIVSNE